MPYSYSLSHSETFTVTHARHLAAKVAADLKRMQRLYGSPSDSDIAAYEAELVALLKAGYLGEVTYGFRRDQDWIEPTLRYTARELAGSYADDDDPGRLRPWADVSGAMFHSYLTHSTTWSDVSRSVRDAFLQTLPFRRTDAPAPGVSGYLEADRTYTAGGRSLARSSVRSL